MLVLGLATASEVVGGGLCLGLRFRDIVGPNCSSQERLAGPTRLLILSGPIVLSGPESTVRQQSCLLQNSLSID